MVGKPEQGSGYIQSAIKANSAEINRLRAEVALYSQKPSSPRVAKTVAPTNKSDEYNKLMERLETMELAIERMGGETTSVSARQEAYTESRRALLDSLRDNTHRNEFEPNWEAEELFEADSDLAVVGASEAISDTFHTLSDNLQLAEVYCKSSICKVSYSEVAEDGSQPGTSTDELLDQISENLGGVDLDVRHDMDSQGNKVLYVQML